MRLVSFMMACVVTLLPVFASPEKYRTSGQSLPAVGYYIAVRATLNGSEQIDLFGASNLPAGSILGVNISDFRGTGSKVFNDETTVAVGKNGLFRSATRPKRGDLFRRNMICDVMFCPTYSNQPASVIKVVGKAGERLGKWDANPQLEGSPRVTCLAATTIVQ